MSRLSDKPAVVGLAEYAPRKRADQPDLTSLEMAADLGALALTDGGIALGEVDGLMAAGIRETTMFTPATVSEYMGLDLRYAEFVDLGGATAAGMLWRAAAAIEAGAASVVLCILVGSFPPPGEVSEAGRFGASSYRPGSPQAEFDVPYGHVGQNALYAMFAQRYAHCHGYDERAMARLVAHQRRSATLTPEAIFHDQPVSEDDVLASKMIARPLRKLEIVMPVWGGAAFVVAGAERARRAPHRPVRITGYGEAVSQKSPQYMRDMLDPPIAPAAAQAFALAGLAPREITTAQVYDCYSITVLLILEAAGFCPKGQGMGFLRERGFGFDGDFPLNTNGGQLGFGQAGIAGGATHVIEAILQVSGRAGARQTPGCDSAFVAGNGGVMSEQVAVVVQGE